MIWKVSAIYKVANNTKHKNSNYARRDKLNSSFDELFDLALGLPAGKKAPCLRENAGK